MIRRAFLPYAAAACQLFADLGIANAAIAPAAQSSDAGAAPVIGTPNTSCVERLPHGKAPPRLTQSMPARGISGHALALEIVVEHGTGETVLPGGFRFGLATSEASALEQAGFVLPDPDGGAGPSLRREAIGERAKTTVSVPFVPLPPKPGRHELTLPPVPIAVARASGELITLCTRPETILVEDPIANTPNPEPKQNPAPRPQRELWTAAKNAVIVALSALVVGALVSFLVSKWLRRPKPAPPPPPPRPAWEVALEELFDIKNARLIKEQRFAEHFDRVTDSVRKYLGARFGFDGLESTTRETLTLLRRVVPPISVLTEIETFLRQADLVKFARLTPTEAECELLLERGEQIVTQTIPSHGQPTPALATSHGGPAAAGPPDISQAEPPPPGVA